MKSELQNVTDRIIVRSENSRASYLKQVLANIRQFPRRKTVFESNIAHASAACSVPAMCDGVTQGQDGMELSLFSRDVIAYSAAIALSHDVFDAVIHLGVCDKIMPGLLIGALRYGYLPNIFAPAGHMHYVHRNSKSGKN